MYCHDSGTIYCKEDPHSDSQVHLFKTFLGDLGILDHCLLLFICKCTPTHTLWAGHTFPQIVGRWLPAMNLRASPNIITGLYIAFLFLCKCVFCIFWTCSHPAGHSPTMVLYVVPGRPKDNRPKCKRCSYPRGTHAKHNTGLIVTPNAWSLQS